MACPPLTYTDITAEWMNAVIARITEAGYEAPGFEGQATMRGFTMAWKYDPEAQTLHIQCLNAPWFISCNMVNSRIDQYVREALARPT
jgi:hypothetical protein